MAPQTSFPTLATVLGVAGVCDLILRVLSLLCACVPAADHFWRIPDRLVMVVQPGWSSALADPELELATLA